MDKKHNLKQQSSSSSNVFFNVVIYLLCCFYFIFIVICTKRESHTHTERSNQPLLYSVFISRVFSLKEK